MQSKGFGSSLMWYRIQTPTGVHYRATQGGAERLAERHPNSSVEPLSSPVKVAD